MHIYIQIVKILPKQKISIPLTLYGFLFLDKRYLAIMWLNTKRIVINNTIYTKILQKVDLRFSNNLELLQIPW